MPDAAQESEVVRGDSHSRPGGRVGSIESDPEPSARRGGWVATKDSLSPRVSARIKASQASVETCCASFLKPCCSCAPGGDCACLTQCPSRPCCLSIVDGRIFTVIITIMTLYALFGDDMRLWLTVKTADDIFFGISSAAFVLFFFELVVNSVARPGFANPPSFFFWLDLLATLSLGPDIGWVWDPIEDYLSGTGSSEAGSDISAQIRAGRAARAGTRAGRVVRVVRLIRLVRVFKLYKQWSRARASRRRAREQEAEAARQLSLDQAHAKMVAGAATGAATGLASASGTTDASGRTEAMAHGRGSHSRKVVPLAGGKPVLSGPSAEAAGGSSRAARRHAAVLKPSAERSGSKGLDGTLASPSNDSRSPPIPTATSGASAGPSGAGGSRGQEGMPSRRWSMNSVESLDYGNDSVPDSGAHDIAGDMVPQQIALDLAINRQHEAEDTSSSSAGGAMASNRGKISNVGIVLSDLTTRRVIVLILVMLIVVPFLAATEQTASEQLRGGLAELHRYPQDVNISEAAFEFNVQQFARHAGKVVYLAICPPESTGCLYTHQVSEIHAILGGLRFDSRGDEPRLANGSVTSDGLTTHPINGWNADLLLATESEVLSKYRDVEVQAYTVDMCFGPDAAGRGADDPDRGLCDSVLWTDDTTSSQDEAFWSFIRTWFVILIITVGAGLFTRDAELLVIRPIERMALLMSKLAADPLAEIQALRRLVIQDAFDSDDEDEDEEEEEDDSAIGKHHHRNRHHASGLSSSSSSSDDDDDHAGDGGEGLAVRRVGTDSVEGSESDLIGTAREGAEAGRRTGAKGSVPMLPVATVRKTPTGEEGPSASGVPAAVAATSATSGRSGVADGSNTGRSSVRRSRAGSLGGAKAARAAKGRRLSGRARSASRGGHRGPELSRYASKRLILADANPVVTAAPVRNLAKEMSTNGHTGKRAANKFSMSRRLIMQHASEEERTATPGAAGGDPKKAGAGGKGAARNSAGKSKRPLAATTSASSAGKRVEAKERRSKRKAESAVTRCAKQSASYVCTSMLNLIGGSAEDASKQAQGSYETAQLENAMVKIGGLLQVGFGEAGADIIGQNMGQSQGKLNPLVPGRRVDAIFGFCDIRRFTDATECLQEEVMVFVNTVGQLVHSCTHRLGGAANKNIGDAFLLTWKLPKLLNPADATLKRRALIHKARGMHAHNRRVSMDAFTSAMDSAPGGAPGGKSLASGPMSSQGEWVGQGMFTSAALVPFGGMAKRAPASPSASAKPLSGIAADAPSKQAATAATAATKAGPLNTGTSAASSHQRTASGTSAQELASPTSSASSGAAVASGAKPPVQFRIASDARSRSQGRGSLKWAQDRPIQEAAPEDEAEEDDEDAGAAQHGSAADPSVSSSRAGAMHAESIASSGPESARKETGPVGKHAADAVIEPDVTDDRTEQEGQADNAGGSGAAATGGASKGPGATGGAPSSQKNRPPPPPRSPSGAYASIMHASDPDQPGSPPAHLPAALSGAGDGTLDAGAARSAGEAATPSASQGGLGTASASSAASTGSVMQVQGGSKHPASVSGVHAEGFVTSSRAASYGELVTTEKVESARGDAESPRRRASTPSAGPRRMRITRPSIVPMNLSKEHQHEEGITIIHDPTSAGGAGAGGDGTAGFVPDGMVGIRDRRATARVTDNALAAFLKVIVDIHNANKRHGALYRFRKHKAIRAAFKGDFKVQLGFGLHLGWAVEGAVGSSYKVDASYLSPHVNLASRLEALTKYYGVPLLLSGNFAQELSLDAQRYLRLIDRITVKGSKTPIELYTFDIVNLPSGLGELRENLEPRTEEQREANKVAQEPIINIDFASDPNILYLQEGLPDAFFVDFHAGVRAYIRGQWAEARRLLSQTQSRYRPDGDGPTAALLRTMDKLGAKCGGLAPPDWSGVHVLDSKTG